MNRITFLAPKKSGHHAILHWFILQTGRPAIHYNDVDYKHYLETGELKHRKGHDYKDRIAQAECRHMYKYNRERPLAYTYNGKGDMLEVFSVENPQEIYSGPDHIYIFREWNNILASHIHNQMKENLIVKAKNTWELYKDSFIKTIYYELWTKDEVYRNNICRKFGLELNDKGLKDQSPFGTQKDWKNSTRLDRWKEYKDHELFKKYAI